GEVHVERAARDLGGLGDVGGGGRFAGGDEACGGVDDGAARAIAMGGAAAGGAMGKANAEKAGISAEHKAGALVVQPEDAEVYSLLGGGEARLILTGER